MMTERNPFEQAIFNLMRGLGHVEAPRVDVVPTPEQIEDIGVLIKNVARLGDEFMRAVGAELKANAPMPLYLERHWNTPFFDAIDGFALFDVARVAEMWRAWRTKFASRKARKRKCRAGQPRRL